MDTSEQYIKMCEKAREIWNTWKYKIGDYVVFRDIGRFDKSVGCRLIRHVNNAGTIFLVGDHEFESYEGQSFYPLPRQDQLQEMVKRQHETYHALLDRFEQWRMGRGFENYGSYTCEQLWLAFVMKEKYGKVWNGKEFP